MRLLSIRLNNKVLIFILLGFLFRVIQLGNDSFWNDEAGVALVAVSSLPEEVFSNIRAHAMAMPFDYLVAWLFARVGLQEFIMRFASVIWGTLTLAVSYQLFRSFFGAQEAVLTTALLAFSPLHVHYSQELRFYASLLCFYYLSWYTLRKAIDESSLRAWIVFVLTTTIGVYFHVYTLLVVINGIYEIKLLRNGSKSVSFWISVALILLLFIPGYIYFGAHQRFAFPLLQYDKNVFSIIAKGLGWKALPYIPHPYMVQIWGVLCFVSCIVGSLVVHSKGMSKIIFSAVTQILFIITADALKGYWFLYRQLLFLHPLALFLSGTGLVWLSNKINSLQRDVVRGKLINMSIFVIYFLIGLFALNQYYLWPKSIAREISAAIIDLWQPGDIILVIPGYQERIYRFYLTYKLGGKEIVPYIRPMKWENLEERRIWQGFKGTAFLVLAQWPVKQELKYLESLSFQILIEPEIRTWGWQALLRRG